jgi:hypothetical protein
LCDFSGPRRRGTVSGGLGGMCMAVRRRSRGRAFGVSAAVIRMVRPAQWTKTHGNPGRDYCKYAALAIAQ